jgi:hypothetical protein
VQTCSRCQTQSADAVLVCPTCQADLWEFSVNAITLQHLRDNPRVELIRISAGVDACPICQEANRAYPKNDVPKLPHQGCSHALGCRCCYEPVLNQIYP